MPWKEVSKMSLKREFIQFALEGKHTFSELCSRFKISRPTGYEWLDRFKKEGESGLEERSRRPQTSPKKTAECIEKKVLAIRQAKPCWGGRKIQAILQAEGEEVVPASSTITDILNRHHLIEKSCDPKQSSPHRFEHEAPNDLWQADFKGHVAMLRGRCHPLTVLDDHSRFSIGLKACDNQQGVTVKQHFIELFRDYGLPWRMNFDNGSPWGSSHLNRSCRYTEFSLWLIRLGIRVSFSRPGHPQTNGKEERFHRTLKAELLRYYTFKDCEEAQRYFNQWREEYNMKRPHEALNMKVPLSRYQLSPRRYPESLPEIEYSPTDQIIKVKGNGMIRHKGHDFFVSESLRGLPIGLREYDQGKYHVYFCQQKLFGIDLNKG